VIIKGNTPNVYCVTDVNWISIMCCKAVLGYKTETIICRPGRKPDFLSLISGYWRPPFLCFVLWSGGFAYLWEILSCNWVLVSRSAFVSRPCTGLYRLQTIVYKRVT
jgi:hypothetical protein